MALSGIERLARIKDISVFEYGNIIQIEAVDGYTIKLERFLLAGRGEFYQFDNDATDPPTKPEHIYLRKQIDDALNRGGLLCKLATYQEK